MDPANEILLQKLTRREFRERMASGELRVCIIPVAAIEQHLEHLAMEHDWRSCSMIAQEVARRLQPNVLVAQGLMCGISEHHMKHLGTLTLSPGSFLAVLGDMIDAMVRAGFSNILVLNGHGGNIRPCKGVWDQFQLRHQMNLHFLPYWDVLNEEDAKLLDTQRIPGHAQEFETAFALAAFPENVRTNMWTDQVDQTPSMATAEKGAKLIETIIERVTQYVRDMMEGTRIEAIPPFHP